MGNLAFRNVAQEYPLKWCGPCKLMARFVFDASWFGDVPPPGAHVAGGDGA